MDGVLAVVLIGLLLGLIWAVRALVPVRLVTIPEYWWGVLTQRGRIIGPVEPGTYWTCGGLREIQILDRRPEIHTLQGQELLTKDRLSIKISVNATLRITDPVKLLKGASNSHALVHEAAQTILREQVTVLTLDEVLDDRDAIAAGLKAGLEARLDPVGYSVQDVKLRDIMLPGPLKTAYAAAEIARKEGLAALERARAEQAALRALANAARMLDGNPALSELRLLQTVAADRGGRVTLVVDRGEKALKAEMAEQAAEAAPKRSKRAPKGDATA